MKRLIQISLLIFCAYASIAQSTDAELTTQANVIRNETIPGANTPLRIGNMFRALIDSKKNLDEAYTSTTLTTNNYAVTINPGVTGFAKDFGFYWKANATNTGAVTLTINGLSSKAVRKNGSSALASGDVVAGRMYPVIYDVAQGWFQILIPGSGGGGGATAFTDLSDVPNAYTGQANKVVSVKGDETGLEFTTAGGGGSQDLQSVLDEGSSANIGDAAAEITAQDVDNYAQWNLNPNGMSIGSSNLANSAGSTLDVGVDGVRISDTRTNRGLQGIADYSANITANDYPQKVYVDAGLSTKQGTLTNSAGLRAALSDESGTGNAYFQGGDIGTPSAGVATNLTGTASGLTAGTVTTNANLTGDVTSSGNATSIASGVIVDADVNASAAIAGTKIANTPAGNIAATTAQAAINELDAEKASEFLTVNNQTTNYTLVLTDADTKLVEMNSASSNTVTIPPNSSVAFPTGTIISVVQQGAGNTAMVAGAGVTIRSQSGVLTSPGQYSPMVIEKRATDEWYLWNGTSAITASNGLSVSAGNITLGGPLTVDANISGTKNLGLGITPTATLHLRAGTATAATAPLKLTSGTLMTSAEAGAIEFLTDDFFATISTGTARKAFILDNGNRLTSGRVPFSTTNGRLIDQSGFSFASSILTVPNLINSGLTSGRVTFATTSGQLTDDSGFLFSGTNDLLTARLTPPAGTTAASTAPIKLTSGTNMTTPEAGAVEFDGTNYFVTSSTTRYTLAKTLMNTATLDFASTAAGTSTDLTITVTGAADGDAVTVGVPNGSTVSAGTFTAWVSASNTVTVRFSNNNLVSALDPASGTFRASVIKY